MRRLAKRLAIYLLILAPFLGAAALVYYNVEREIALPEAVSITIGEVKGDTLINTRLASSSERMPLLDWLFRQQTGWKMMWREPPRGVIAIVLAHRHVPQSTLQLMPGFLVFSNEEGNFFKKIDAAQYAEALRLVGYTP